MKRNRESDYRKKSLTRSELIGIIKVIGTGTPKLTFGGKRSFSRNSLGGNL